MQTAGHALLALVNINYCNTVVEGLPNFRIMPGVSTECHKARFSEMVHYLKSADNGTIMLFQ